MKTLSTLFLLLTSNLFGQIYYADTLCKADSISLEQSWQQFSKDFLKHDTTNLQNSSLEFIACDICLELKESTDNYFVLADTFIFQAFRNLPNTESWTLLGSAKHTFSLDNYSDYQFKNFQHKNLTSTYIYVVNIKTSEPIEWENGYSGTSYDFKFVKVEERFKLFGFTSH